MNISSMLGNSPSPSFSLRGCRAQCVDTDVFRVIDPNRSTNLERRYSVRVRILRIDREEMESV